MFVLWQHSTSVHRYICVNHECCTHVRLVTDIRYTANRPVYYLLPLLKMSSPYELGYIGWFARDFGAAGWARLNITVTYWKACNNNVMCFGFYTSAISSSIALHINWRAFLRPSNRSVRESSADGSA